MLSAAACVKINHIYRRFGGIKMRKTKIVCTLGPSTDDKETLRAMILAGMDVARLNFSHGSHEEHKKRADLIKALRAEMNVPLALMIDTKGPDIRVGRFFDNFQELRTGDSFTLTTGECLGDMTRASVTYAELPKKLTLGDTVMLDDGLIELRVESCTDTEVVCTVINGGIIANNKSLNVPGVKLDIPYMREKDIEDINFAIDNGFDYVAASFVRSYDDVWQVRKILEERGASDIKIISKIENSEGIENIAEIMAVSDSIMVARGDMGVEIPFFDLPSVQKELIKKAMKAGDKVITATQMLESMIKNPRPTRAEVSDVANAIYDGTSAIMLSGETSVGRFPVETVRTMAQIAEVTERDIDYRKRFMQLDWDFPTESFIDAISHSICSTAYKLKNATILVLTIEGMTARLISRYRPAGGFVAFTHDPKVYNQLSLNWGCVPMLMEQSNDLDFIFKTAVEKAKEAGLVSRGDTVVFTGSVPAGASGGSHKMQIAVVN